MEKNMIERMDRRLDWLLTALAAAAALALGGFLTQLSAQTTGGFRFAGPLARVITPNGDGRNDLMFFCYDNPSDGDVSGKIYTLLGAEVASTGPRTAAAGTACPGGLLPGSAQYSTWDGRSAGSVVRSGVYVYRISAEGRTFSGTLLVVR
jgi:hypothetical protein